MQVWILEAGSLAEGDSVLGVYAEQELAHPAFEREARQLLQTAAAFHAKFNPHKDSPVDVAEQDEDGSLRLYAAGDYVTLTPHDVVTSASGPTVGSRSVGSSALPPELERSTCRSSGTSSSSTADRHSHSSSGRPTANLPQLPGRVVLWIASITCSFTIAGLSR